MGQGDLYVRMLKDDNVSGVPPVSGDQQEERES